MTKDSNQIATVDIPLWHPVGPLSHPEIFEASLGVYLALGLVMLGLLLWLALDWMSAPAPTESRGNQETAPARPPMLSASDDPVEEPLVVGRAPRARPPAAAAPIITAVRQPAPLVAADQSIHDAHVKPVANPVRVMALVLGVLVTLVAIDHVRAVEALAGFVRSANAAQIGRMAMTFPLLVFAGAVLALPAPRWSAVMFGGAGAVGLILATAELWQRELRWWDAAYVLQSWQFLPYWSGVTFGLAGVALLGAWYQPRQRNPTRLLRLRSVGRVRRWLWSS